uniref:Uncharacterized protein n=1 Tax=Acrobeloides nanus TaxID=290746 RepID=A0A914CU40_9BILA
MISYRIVNPVTITIVNGTFHVGYYEPIMSIAVLAGTLWQGKPFIFVIFTTFFIPTAMISYRIVNPVIINVVNGTFEVGYYEPIMSIAILAGTVISFATTGIELVLEICTGFALVFFTKTYINQESNSKRTRHEIRLFEIVREMYMLANSLLLFLISSFVRQGYMKFYKISSQQQESTTLFTVTGNRNVSPRSIQTSAVEPR